MLIKTHPFKSFEKIERTKTNLKALIRKYPIYHLSKPDITSNSYDLIFKTDIYAEYIITLLPEFHKDYETIRYLFTHQNIPTLDYEKYYNILLDSGYYPKQPTTKPININNLITCQ